MGAVLDERQVVAGGDARQLVHGAGPPGEVDGQDRPGARRETRLDLGGFDVHRLGVHVGEHGRGAGVDDGVDRGAEGQRRGDHLVAGPHPRREERQVEGRRARVHGDGVRGVLVGGEVALEPRHLGAGAEPSAAEAVDDLGDLDVLEGRGPKDQEVIVHVGVGGLRPRRAHPQVPTWATAGVVVGLSAHGFQKTGVDLQARGPAERLDLEHEPVRLGGVLDQPLDPLEGT